MAYLRFTETCGVYFYQHADGGYECCGCLLAPASTEPAFVQFSNQEEAAWHLSEHRNFGHASREAINLAIDQLLGYEPRTPDLVIEEIVRQARAAGPDSRVASADVDVPADMRVTLEQMIEHMEAREQDPDSEAAEAIVPQEVLREIPSRLRGGREASPN